MQHPFSLHILSVKGTDPVSSQQGGASMSTWAAWWVRCIKEVMVSLENSDQESHQSHPVLSYMLQQKPNTIQNSCKKQEDG